MRRRSRSRGGSFPPLSGLCILFVILGLTFGGGLGTAAFTTGTVDRSSAVDIVADSGGALRIDTAERVQLNSTAPLVNTTNHLGQPVTVTIALRSASVDRGDLIVNGENYGDSVSLSLAREEPVHIRIAVPNNSSLAGENVRFDVRASGAGIDISAPDRYVPIEA